jgi:cephalosporin hydroxylase
MANPIGTYWVDRVQPMLSGPELEIIRQFHNLYYRRWREGADTINLSWFGHQVWKCPLDLWVYQEILARSQPDFVIECGTFAGGSALYLAIVLDVIGNGQVITVDIDPHPGLPQHPRITYLTGSSTDPAVIRQIVDRVAGRRAIVILDSDHHAEHVLKELRAYSELVQPGDYLIVEDTNLNGHPVWEDYGPGPMEAVERFLADHPEFEVDSRCERLLMTLQPGGYLRRKQVQSPSRGSRRD